MSRVLLAALLAHGVLLINAGPIGADSQELFVAIRNGDHASTRRLLCRNATGKSTIDSQCDNKFPHGHRLPLMCRRMT